MAGPLLDRAGPRWVRPVVRVGTGPRGRLGRGLLALVGASLLGAAGCTIWDGGSEGNIDYRSARRAPSLEVPPDLATPRGNERFTVPPAAGEATFSQFERTRQGTVAQPNAIRVLPTVDLGRVEREGDHRWLVLNMPPEQVWPIAREFWIESGFTIAREAPELGVLETEWAENRAKLPEDFIRRSIGRVLENLYSTGERDKFRMRIERAGDGSEVYIAHSGLREVYVSPLQDATGWEHRPTDPGLEAEFLRRLLVRLGASQQQSEQMMAGAQQAQPPERARLVGVGPAALVRIDEPFERAWRRVALGLDRAGFTVEDRNRAAGHFYVRYIDPEVQAQSRGLLARMFGGDPDAPAPRQFRIELIGAGQSTDVRVRSASGEPVAGDVDQALAERMLAVIRDELK